MEKITILIQKNVLRDVEIALKESKLEGMIIPDIVFEIMKQVEDTYEKDVELVQEANRLTSEKNQYESKKEMWV